MSADEALRKSSALVDLAPPDWFPNGTGQLWVTCYRVLRAEPNELVPPLEVPLDKVGVHFIWGDVKYLDSTDLKLVPVTHDNWRLEGNPTERQTGEQSLVLLLTRHATGDEEGDEATTRASVNAAVGLIIAVCGRNAAYEKIFENVIDVGASTSSAFSSVMLNPMSIRAPAIRANLQTLERAGRQIQESAPEQTASVNLALRWIEQASYDAGVDAFLKLWVAIETMSMPNTTNIAPINRALATMYSIPLSAVQPRFAVGRLLGLRSKIVHDGATPSIHSHLLDYLEALFFDLLAFELRLSHEGRAGALIEALNLDLVSLVSPISQRFVSQDPTNDRSSAIDA